MARQSAARRRHETDEWQHLISGDPKILGGKPIIKGTRMSVSLVVGAVGGGMTVDEVMHEYRLTRAQVLAALTYAAEAPCQGRRLPSTCKLAGLTSVVRRETPEDARPVMIRTLALGRSG